MGNCCNRNQSQKTYILFYCIVFLFGLSVGAAQIASEDRSMWIVEDATTLSWSGAAVIGE